MSIIMIYTEFQKERFTLFWKGFEKTVAICCYINNVGNLALFIRRLLIEECCFLDEVITENSWTYQKKIAEYTAKQ